MNIDKKQCDGKTSRSAALMIAEFLRDNTPEEFNAKTVSNRLNLEYGTVRKVLSRSVIKPSSDLIRTQRGFYRYKTDQDLIRRICDGKPIKLHAIKIEGRSLKDDTRVSFETTLTPDKKDPEGRWCTYSEEWEGRTIKFKLHDCDLIEIWLNSSNQPLSFGEFERFASFLKGQFTLEDTGNWLLTAADLNVDVQELRLSGVGHLSLKCFRNAWFTLYQKNEAILRVEINHTPTDLSLCEAVSILQGLTTAPRCSCKGGCDQ